MSKKTKKTNKTQKILAQLETTKDVLKEAESSTLKAQGSLELIDEQLEELGYNSAEKAETGNKKLSKLIVKLSDELEELTDEFVGEFGELLDL